MQKAKTTASRTIFSTEDRLNRRGVRAMATSWGFCSVRVAEGGTAHYVSMGIPENVRAPRISPKARQHLAAVRATGNREEIKKANQQYMELVASHNESRFHRCRCGYSEAATIGDRPELCPSCRADDLAIWSMGVQAECGINLGWRMPPLEKRWDLLGMSEMAGFGGDRRINRLIERERIDKEAAGHGDGGRYR